MPATEMIRAKSVEWKKSLHDTRNERQNHTEEEVVSDTRKVAFGTPGIECQGKRGNRRDQERLSQDEFIRRDCSCIL